ncbi:protein DDC8 homolog [Carlito syrichta]|uniref:Protein DDC8 homolog n=1 Tax=Carlito syrichta TaxID=1868482 RepID=A0A3Q0DFV3_CARSF|nr:protein DDC8 homolog [Carlito syrichta]
MPPDVGRYTGNPRHLGHLFPSGSRNFQEVVSAEFSVMKGNVDRVAWPSPSPDDKAWLLKQKHALLQVTENGDLALQRANAKLWKSYQLQRLAEELGREWQETQHPRHRAPGSLSLACPFGGGGGWAEEDEPDLEVPAQRGAAGPPRTKKKHRALREEKSLKEELDRRQSWPFRPGRTAVGAERKPAATKARVLTHPLLSFPEKRKGKRAPSTKTKGGYCPADPWGSRGMDLQKLNPCSATAGGVKNPEEKETGGAQEGRRQLGKGAVRFAQGLTDNSLDQSLEGKQKSLEQLWSVDSTHSERAVPQAVQGKDRNKNKWQKELEFVFQELFNTNRRLKKYLSLYLELRPRMGQNLDEEQAFSEMRECGNETPEEKTTTDTELMSAGESGSPAVVEACLTASGASSKGLLSKVESHRYHQTAKPTSRNGSQTSSLETGVFTNEEDSPLCSAESGQEPPRPATLVVEGSLAHHPQEQVDRVGLMASRQKHKAEQRRQRQLELLEQPEHPNMSLEIHYMAELEKERREKRRALLAHLKSSYPSRDQERERGSELVTTSPSGTSLTNDDQQSQMTHDLQQQILEQNKLHKQYLEEARKRLQEFQNIC